MLNGHTELVCSVAFSSDGTHIVSGSADNSVRVWDVLTGQERHLLKGHTDSVYSVAFSRDDSHIISGSNDESVWVWDALIGEEKHVLHGHTDRVTSVAFSSDDSHIVSGSYDTSVHVWDALMGSEKHMLNSHTYSVNLFASRYIREKIDNSTDGPSHTGWLISPQGEEYLMFVPPGERLPDDANILTIPHSYVAHVDFTTSRLGPEWSSCYSP